MNLFDILTHMDYNDQGLYDALREDPEGMAELRKNIGWLIPQWMTGADRGADHADLVLMFDELCNPGWSSFTDHPELQTKLLALVGLGKKTKHKFYRPAGKTAGSAELAGLLRSEYPDISETELALYCRDADITELEDLMDRWGVQQDDRKTIVKQFEKMRKV